MIDWITFTSKIHSCDQICKVLGLDWSKFNDLGYGRNRYQFAFQFENITILFSSDIEKYNDGLCVILSGRGCRDFEKYGNGDYKSLFQLILDNWNIDTNKRKMNITRIDYAFDDFNNGLNLNTVADYTRKGYFVSSCKCVTKDREGNIVSKGKYNICESECGLTIYFGSRSSNIMIRFYDKFLEKLNNGCAEELPEGCTNWVRCEIELKNINCIGFIKLFLNKVDCALPSVFAGADNTNFDLFFGVLNNYIRFVDPSSDSNIRRWPLANFWSKFINEYTNRYSTYINIGVPVTIDKLVKYHNKYMSASEVTLLTSKGVKEYLFIIISGMLSKKNVKQSYKDIVRNNEFSEDWSFYDLVNLFLNNDKEFCQRIVDLGKNIVSDYPIYDSNGFNTGLMEFRLNDLFIDRE